MKTVVFENPGVIDPRAITTFGVSAKENENPIGYFGTGLKYAIAILLREGHSIEIFAGEECYSFEKNEFEMRGKKFDGVTINGAPLPFTLELGKNWETWQAFRELYCNALDEKGSVWSTDSDFHPKHYERFGNKAAEGKTLVVVRGEPIGECFKNRGDIVLSLDRKLQLETKANVEVYNKPSNSVYYRGVRVMDLPNRALYTYNIMDDIELTEDRTVKYGYVVTASISEAISGLTDSTAIYRAITAGQEWHENNLEFSSLSYYETKGSDQFYEMVAREYEANNDKLNRSARNIHAKRMRASTVKNYQPEECTPVEQKQLDRAIMICTKAFPEFVDYKVLVVKTLGQETMALADEAQRSMVISKRCFTMGTKYLTSTLIEEYFHLKTGYTDCSRALQTHLFDTICSLIENHLIQEPI